MTSVIAALAALAGLYGPPVAQYIVPDSPEGDAVVSCLLAAGAVSDARDHADALYVTDPAIIIRCGGRPSNRPYASVNA